MKIGLIIASVIFLIFWLLVDFGCSAVSRNASKQEERKKLREELTELEKQTLDKVLNKMKKDLKKQNI